MELLKLTRPEIDEYRSRILKALRELENVESELTDKFSEDEYTEYTEGGDDPISNLVTAVETAKEAYGDINADSDWIEVQE